MTPTFTDTILRQTLTSDRCSSFGSRYYRVFLLWNRMKVRVRSVVKKSTKVWQGRSSSLIDYHMTHCIYQFEIACTAAERSTTNIRRSCDTKIRRFRCSISGCRLIKPILSMVCSKKKTLIITRQLNKPGERTTHTLHFSATVPQVWSMIPVATLKRIHTHTTIGLRSGSRSS